MTQSIFKHEIRSSAWAIDGIPCNAPC